ncbi:uncharacterized protein [Montipora foliosa]|uniref:uncharacterized protein n=1 Tax=Montipora foliosa TaxID=591990 RepID=UPI0035F20F3F
MESWRLSLILAAVACSCCLVLCVFLMCLCIMVKRIRRNLDDIRLRRGPTDSLEDPRGCKQEEDEGNRRNSNNLRYILRPIGGQKQRRDNPSIYSKADEHVIYLRPESGTPSQNLSGAETQASTEHVPLQFVNQGFSHPETSRNSMVANQSEASDDLQSVLEKDVASENEQPTYENTIEPIYQNTGELASLNNPDLERCHTMAISDIDKCS